MSAKKSSKQQPNAEACACLPIQNGGPGLWWWDGFNATFLPIPDGVGTYHLAWDKLNGGLVWVADNAAAPPTQ